MSDTPPPAGGTASDTDRIAAQWFARVQTEPLTAREQAALDAWLAADDRHRAAYDALDAVWSDLGVSDTLAAQAARVRAATEPAPGLTERLKRAGWWGGLKPFLPVGAAVAAAVLVVAVFMAPPEEADPRYGDARQTVVAEVRDEVLEDGSVVTLGARSSIRVSITQTERRVVLSDGVAFFSVQEESTRPFYVEAGETTIRVVGTKFDVHRGPEGVAVSVLEGVVDVFETGPANASGERKRRLTAGQRSVSTTAGDIASVARISAGEAGAWRTGRLIYDNASLREVVADANRYYDGEIVFEQRSLGDLKVTASFRTDEIDAMINTLTLGLPVEADRSTPGRILLRGKPDDA